MKKSAKKSQKPSRLLIALCVALTGALIGMCGFAITADASPETTGQAPGETTTQPTTQITTAPTTEPTTAPTTETTTVPPETLAGQALGLDDWRLVLVNPWNSLPEGFEVELADAPNDRKVDARCIDDLMEMVNAMQAEGLKPIFRSGYRTNTDQRVLYENRVQRFRDQGYSKSEAEKKAATVVAIPGTSEHQLGLAVDIVDDSYRRLDEKQEGTPVQQWLMVNSWRYGFILRYPNGTTHITGIIYEPWHYRYVGKEVAAEIYEMGITLEEYLELLQE